MTVLVGDCLDIVGAMKPGTCEAVVSDPPSGIAFMGLKFDLDHGGEDKWIAYMAQRFAAQREACIPGAYGLFWALPRTQDWTMQALRRAGWKICQVLSHWHGQGWPKGRGQLKPAHESWILCRDPRGKVRDLNVDACRVARGMGGNSATNPNVRKARGCKMAMGPGGFKLGESYDPERKMDLFVNEGGSYPPDLTLTHCAACRPMGARKVRSNAQSAGPTNCGPTLVMGTAALNASRKAGFGADGTETVPAWECLAVCECGLASTCLAGGAPTPCACGGERWWACPAAMLDEQSGMLNSQNPLTRASTRTRTENPIVAANPKSREEFLAGIYADAPGGASRFFPQFHYDAKASRRERQVGCEGLLWVRDKTAPIGWRRVSAEEHAAAPEKDRMAGNVHATIKPIGCGTDDGFMRWAVRLVTPEGGPIVDGMLGSGSTGVAAQIEGRAFYGCDIDPGAVDIAKARMAHWTQERHLSLLAKAPKRKGVAPAPQVTAPPPASAPKQLDIFGGHAA